MSYIVTRVITNKEDDSIIEIGPDEFGSIEMNESDGGGRVARLTLSVEQARLVVRALNDCVKEMSPEEDAW
jgi:hypothetical protein